VHIIGGGSQNALLCQFTADATRLPVLAGPVEATAIGNLLAQAKAHGWVKSNEEMTQVVLNSFPTEEYSPAQNDAWEESYSRFKALLRQSG
jgi:sugar (pentulose or hexulose) kinase